jgi:hypothetical protein
LGAVRPDLPGGAHHAGFFAVLARIWPELKSLKEDQTLTAAVENQGKSRKDFIERLAQLDPETVDQGWQKSYVRGQSADGPTKTYHLTKRRLKMPQSGE